MSALSSSPPLDGFPRSCSYQPGEPLFCHHTSSTPPSVSSNAIVTHDGHLSSSSDSSPSTSPMLSSAASSPIPLSSSSSASSLPSPVLSYHTAAPNQHPIQSARGEGVRLEGVPEGEDEQSALCVLPGSTHLSSRNRRRLRAEGERHSTLQQSSGSSSAAAAARSAVLSGLVTGSVARSSVSALVEDKAEAWQKLMNLKSLLSAGFITRSEYKERKSQLIDEMTGTTLTQTQQNSSGASVTASTTFSSSRHPHPSPLPTNLPTIIPRAPPDFSVVLPERATKYTFDLVSRSWQATSVLVKLDPVPFSRGALRLVYHLQELDEPPPHPLEGCMDHTDERQEGEADDQHELSSASSIASDSSSSLSAVSSSARSTADVDDIQLPLSPRHIAAVKSANTGVTYVAKISMDPRDNEDREIYFRDVEMQTLARYYAALFNEYNPLKLVDFVKASLLRLEEREGQPLCGVERYIEGQYRKWFVYHNADTLLHTPGCAPLSCRRLSGIELCWMAHSLSVAVALSHLQEQQLWLRERGRAQHPSGVLSLHVRVVQPHPADLRHTGSERLVYRPAAALGRQ